MLKEIQANIWNKQFDSYWRIIPINCQVKDNGELVMGAGLAKEAAKRYDNLATHWGAEMRDKKELETSVRRIAQITETDKHLFIGTLFDHTNNLIGFPTKYHWKDKSSLILIENHLKHLINVGKCRRAIDLDFKIVSPRLGCGLGNLNWEKQVKHLVEKYFGDDENFVVAYQ